MGTKPQQSRIVQYMYGIRCNDWVTVRGYDRGPPTCDMCRKNHAAYRNGNTR